MNRNLQVLIEVAAAGGFAVSALLTSLRTLSGWTLVTSTPLSFERTLTGRMSLGGGTGELSLLGLVAQPTTAILWALLAAVLVAVVLHLAARLRARRAAPQPPAIALGLAMAALWPWVIGPAPLPGLAGHLDRVPLVGRYIKRFMSHQVLKRMRFLSHPNRRTGRRTYRLTQGL